MDKSKKPHHQFETFSVQPFEQDGKTHHYAMGPEGAIIVPVTDDGKIMLIREYRANTGKWHWYLPAGRVTGDDGNDLEGAHRELREETGYDAAHMKMMFTTQSKTKWYKQKKTFFVAWGLHPAPLDSGDEIIPPEVHCMDIAQVAGLLMRCDENGMREIDDDMGDALYHFIFKYGIKRCEFHGNLFDAVAQKAGTQNNAAQNGVTPSISDTPSP